MREIKIKFWDTKDHKWLKAGSSIIGTIFYWKTSQEVSLVDDRYKPVFYTGLKDKNGKEVYNGYIVQQHRDICIINRCVGGFECQMISGPHKGSTFTFNYLNEKHCEIIGNIYENPDLLEGDNHVQCM